MTDIPTQPRPFVDENNIFHSNLVEVRKILIGFALVLFIIFACLVSGAIIF